MWGGGATTLAKLISKRTRRKYIRRTYPDWDGILERVHQILMLSSLLCLGHPCRLQLLERAAFGSGVLLRKQSEHDQELWRELLRKTEGIERVGLHWGGFYGRDVDLLARLLLVFSCLCPSVACPCAPRVPLALREQWRRAERVSCASQTTRRTSLWTAA